MDWEEWDEMALEIREMKKEKRGCDTPDFMAELNGDSCSDETAADLANLERFISEDTSDGIINADTFKDLISEIHDLPPEFMEEFDFGSTSESKNLGQQAGITTTTTTTITANSSNTTSITISTQRIRRKRPMDHEPSTRSYRGSSRKRSKQLTERSRLPCSTLASR